MTRNGFIAVNGGRIYYAIDGNGPAVTLVHAGIADHTMWDAQVSALSAQYTVLRYDTRGFGRSTTEDVPFTNRADLMALLDQLGITQTALIGCSRGGQIALDTAVTNPERITKFVWVCSGVAGYEQPGEAFDRARSRSLALWKRPSSRTTLSASPPWMCASGSMAPCSPRAVLRLQCATKSTRWRGIIIAAIRATGSPSRLIRRSPHGWRNGPSLSWR
ncbi:alpha/beta fold hydrolase [Candidatus Gracilibacteria bacterium]|nr:alpha/beta fold hydrolase [Candidatus Gracilibacteria bacterium]